MKYVALFALLFALHSAAFAQEYPKSELYAGYSLLRADSETVDFVLDGLNASAKRSGASLNGFNLSLTYNPSKWAGLIVDGGGNYGSVDYSATLPGLSVTAGVRTNVHTFLAGPQFYLRRDRATFFVRGMAGVVFLNQSFDLRALGGPKVDFDDKGFGAGVGGGVDVNLSSRISFRAVQADYLFAKFGDQKFVINGQTLSSPDTQHAIRISTGFTFRN